MAKPHITVVETPEFQRQAKPLLDPGEVRRLIDHLAANPKDGDLIQGTGGVRKLRWKLPGGGKSGGLRVIHFYHDDDMPLYLFTVYKKGRKDTLTHAECNALKAITRAIVDAHKGGR